MTKKLTIDKAGRVVIPKSLRDNLHLRAGDSLQLESFGEEITLKPIRDVAPLHKEKGIWVFRSGQPIKTLSIPALIDKVREERFNDILGLNEDVL